VTIKSGWDDSGILLVMGLQEGILGDDDNIVYLWDDKEKQSRYTPRRRLGRGGIAPTHSRPRHQMGVSGQLHAPAALCLRERTPGTHCTGG
jgi:hypothetical protein